MPQYQAFKGEVGDVTFTQVEDHFNGVVVCTLAGAKASGERMSATWRLPFYEYFNIVSDQRGRHWKETLRALIEKAWAHGDVPPPTRQPNVVFTFTSSGGYWGTNSASGY